MIYRHNPAYPPIARSADVLIAELICESACRAVIDGPELLALHCLDARSQSELLRLLAIKAAEISAAVIEAGYAHAPLGSGRRQARDRGGRIAAAADVWVRSWLRVEHDDTLPYSPYMRRVWDIAHPAVSAALRALRRAEPAEIARTLPDALAACEIVPRPSASEDADGDVEAA